MKIKSKKITYNSLVYDRNNSKEMNSYKYLRVYLHHKLNWNYGTENIVNGGWKTYFGLENNCKSMDLWLWNKNKLLFETFITFVILYGCEIWGYDISRESRRKIKQIRKRFINYNVN